MIADKVVCVLTPPRSGSSLTTRVLHILGVYLGGDDVLAKPSKDNPKGYWEHESIIEINEAILSRYGFSYSRAGADWTHQPCFPDGWETDPGLDDIKARAIGIIRRDMVHHRVWGWKDPRTCFTLPFWQSILPQMHYVICIRNPLDVASSQERFLDCSYERGLYLWLLYLKFALQFTSGEKRVLINVESWMDESQDTLGGLAGFLGCAQLADDVDVREAVEMLVDKGLWHHRTSSGSASMTLAVHERLRTEESADSGVCDMVRKALDHVAPEAARSDVAKVELAKHQWGDQLRRTINELNRLIPRGSNVILVDHARIGPEVLEGRDVTPFLERNGEYWGCPADSTVAVDEFKRLREVGARYVVFAWPAHWWLDYYSDFDVYLRSHFHCILQNERVIVFDTQGPLGP
jgi:hypothetical protein